jgi:hypothetical protein
MSRASLWLPLLRRLTDISPRWIVWKNAESALEGTGDVDSAVRRADWPPLMEAFHSWAGGRGLGPVIECPHAPNVMHLVALQEAEPFFEVDLMAKKIFLGSTLFDADHLLPLAVMDARGFRRARPGAEGLMKLVYNGVRRDGTANVEGLANKRIGDLLSNDPEGARLAASALFGAAERAGLRLAERVANGGWDRRAALELQGWFLLRAAREPRSVLARVRFHAVRTRCPVLSAVTYGGRRVPDDQQEWLARVRRDHVVI